MVSKFQLSMPFKASYLGVRIIFQMSLKVATLDHYVKFHYLYSNRNLDAANMWLQVNALFYMILCFRVLQMNILETISLWGQEQYCLRINLGAVLKLIKNNPEFMILNIILKYFLAHIFEQQTLPLLVIRGSKNT